MKLFIDRDLGGKQLGGALRAVHVQVVCHRERYPNADAETVPDTQWIREAAELGEIILTRDGGIHRVPAEIEALATAGARGFVLETRNATPFVNLRALMLAWPAMEQRVADEPGAFLYGINREGRLMRRYPKTGANQSETGAAS